MILLLKRVKDFKKYQLRSNPPNKKKTNIN